MEHIGYENNCTCPPCLKKYSRWQKAILKIELQECFNEFKKISADNKTLNEIDKEIKDYLKL